MDGVTGTIEKAVNPIDTIPEDEGQENPMPDAVEEPARSGDVPAEIHPHRVVESILLSADTPLAAAKIANILDVGNARDVRKHIETLNTLYAEQRLSFRIEQIAGGYQILTLPEYNTWITKLHRVRQETKLSAAAMETLAIVAYKQPCTRADIESVRGVAAGDMLNRLREMNVVKIVGRAEDLGRPLLYGTTKRFLEVFGLPSLDDLPQVEALRSGGEAAKSEESESADVSETPPELVDSALEIESDETLTVADEPSVSESGDNTVDEPVVETGVEPALSLVEEEDEAPSEDSPES